MSKTIVGGVLTALVLVATPALAQQNGIASRVASQLGTKFQNPACELKEGHFLVSSAKTKVSSQAGSSDPVIGARLLKQGREISLDAITNKGQDKNPAAWYWLGRITLLEGDMVGADSAFTRAVALAPQCKADVQDFRSRAWSGLVLGAQEFVTQKNVDSAKVLYRAALAINREAPHGFNGLAGIFYDAGQTDSAIAYFSLAAATNPTDPAYVKVRNKAAFNAAVLLVNARRFAEAVPAFQRYLSFEPDDIAAKKGLAQAYRGAGMADSAQAMERMLVASAGAGGANAGGDDGVSEDDLMEIAIKQYNDKNYAEAVTTFGRILAVNPNNRNALFTLANAYVALQQGSDASATAQKLIALEPLSENDHTLWAQGQKLAGSQDGLYKALVAREGLLVNVEVENLKVAPDGASLSGKITGREAHDENNKLLPGRALTLVVEFLGKGGAVVASQEVSVPPLKPGETAALNAEGKGAGIQAWRYRVK